MSDVTRILTEMEQGDPAAAEQLLPLAYDELRALAAQKMASEQSDHTLQATALVNEAYLRLHGFEGTREEYLAYAAVAMRRILVEYARRVHSEKRGGDRQRLPLSHVEVGVEGAEEPAELEALRRQQLGRRGHVWTRERGERDCDTGLSSRH